MFAGNRQINQSMRITSTNQPINLSAWGMFAYLIIFQQYGLQRRNSNGLGYSMCFQNPVDAFCVFLVQCQLFLCLSFFICQLFLCLSFCVHLSLLEWWKSVVCQLCQFSGSQQFHRIVDCKHPYLANLVIIKLRASKLSYDSQLPNERL